MAATPQFQHNPPQLNARASELIAKFSAKSATIAVVGMGYVGLPLAKAMHDAGHRVIGFDIDPEKVDQLTRGISYLKHLGERLVPDLAASARFSATRDIALLAKADAIVLCVPTPLGKHHEPDLSFVESSSAQVATILRAGQIVSLESTSYPGTTREITLRLLTRGSGLTCGEDFFLVFSPEREDPGRTDFITHNTPRLVGGVDAQSTAVGAALYASAVKTVISVSSAEVAEAAKLLENTYRAVNIALVNELKPVLMDMGIDIWEVIRAASTKPFGYQPFYPGPGLGGHCIPIDPYYLTYKAREFGHNTRFIELAGEVNHQMPGYVVQRTMLALNGAKKAVNGSRVLVVGIAYKPNVDDIRETPAAEIISQLLDCGAVVEYHDPHVPEFPSMRKYNIALASITLTQQLIESYDAVVIVTDHAVINWRLIADHAKVIVDARDAIGSRGLFARGLLVKA
jgi:UDP-N-acetyl-D-glucosamine dehydrogenase